MKRIIFSLPEELFLALQQVARAERRSMAAVLRDATEETVSRRRARPRPLSVGAGYSGRSDISRRIGEEQLGPDVAR